MFNTKIKEDIMYLTHKVNRLENYIDNIEKEKSKKIQKLLDNKENYIDRLKYLVDNDDIKENQIVGTITKETAIKILKDLGENKNETL